MTNVIGQRIKMIRNDLKLTQAETAKRAKISRTYFADVERGRYNPSLETLNDIAAALETTVEAIISDGEKNSFKIPVFGSVSAGNPLIAMEDIVEWEELPKEWENQGVFYGLRVKGASMEPRISEGDVVIVKKQNDVENGELAIVLIDGDEATFKKVQKGPDGITLIAFNPTVYSPHFYTNNDIKNLPVQIIGKVIEARLKF